MAAPQDRFTFMYDDYSDYLGPLAHQVSMVVLWLA